MASTDSLTTIICLEPTLQISEAIPPFNLSASMTHFGTTLFYIYILPMYISIKRSHTFRSYKGTFLYSTYLVHAHYIINLFHFISSDYINIMKSSNNKPHYIKLCSVMNSLYKSDILLIILISKFLKTRYSFNLKKTHFKPIQMKGMFDLLIQETVHCKWYFTYSESQNKDNLLLKSAPNTFSRVKYLFHKDKLIYGQAILDIAYMKCT